MTSSVSDLPSTLVVSVHKGASTFLAEAFTSAIGQVLPEIAVTKYGSEIILGAAPASLSIPPTGALFVRVYPSDLENLIVEGAGDGDDKFSNLNIVIVHRDPRDAAVSQYYSVLYSHRVDDKSVRKPDAFLEMRAKLEAVSIQQAVLSCGRNAMTEFKGVRALAARYPNAMVSSYEELVTNYDQWLDRFGTCVGWPPDALAKIYEQTSESFVPPAVMQPHEHKRRITPGNWREIFDDRITAIFERECGDEMREAGYDW